MNKPLKIIFLIFTICLLSYVYLPTPAFPDNLRDSLQSNEPADMEDTFRRGYYTNLTREEVVAFYKSEFNKSNNFFSYYTLRLNYPPEEAPVLIRDQTKSTFLEEFTHPLRESLYISGYEPDPNKVKLSSGGKVWRQKVIVRYVPSDIKIRLVVVLLTLASIYLLVREYSYAKKQN